MAELKTDEAGNVILPPGFTWLDRPEPQASPGPSYTPAGDKPQKITGKRNPITELLGNITNLGATGLQMTGLMGGGPFDKPTRAARGVARAVIPQTPVELGMFIATLPLGPEVGAVGRVAKMTLGGAIGGMAHERGESGLTGALGGLMGGIGGEAINKVSRMVTYIPWVKRIAQNDTATVGQAVFDMVPELGKVRSPEEFQATFSRVYGRRKLSEMYDGMVKGIGEQLGEQNRVKVPTMGQTLWGEATGNLTSYRLSGLKAKPGMEVPFEVAIDKVRSLRETSRKMFNSNPVAAADYSAKANMIEQEALDGLPPELQKIYTDGKTAFAKGMAMLHFFDPKNASRKPGEGVLSESGWLDVEKLQRRFKNQGLGQREALFSSAEVAKFQDALFRNAKTGSTITDIAPESPMHTRLHKWGVSIPLFEALTQETKFVGELPSRGNISPLLSSYLGGRAVSEINPNRPNTLKASEEE